MNWTVYWFMLPVCVAVASIAMFSGISGAAMLTPVFLIGFPLLGVPRLTTVAAIGTSLLLETSGFGAGVARYVSMRLVDLRTARSIIAVTLPLGAAGAVLARHVPAQSLRIGYGLAMVALAWVLMRKEPGEGTDEPAAAVTPTIAVPATAGGVSWRGWTEPLHRLVGHRRLLSAAASPAAVDVASFDARAASIPPIAAARPTPNDLSAQPAIVCESDMAHLPCPHGERREIRTAAGRVYVFCAHGLRLQRLISGVGALIAGMISTGVGEATLPGLVRRSRFPVAVAAGTSTVIVAGTVTGAAVTHLIQLAGEGGISAIPWNLIVWAVPGAIAGAFFGTRLQGRVSEHAARVFFSVLFGGIGLVFLLAFTVFSGRFT